MARSRRGYDCHRLDCYQMKTVKKEKLVNLILYGAKKDFEKTNYLKAKFDCVAMKSEVDKLDSITDIKNFIDEIESAVSTRIYDYIRGNKKLCDEFEAYLKERKMEPFVGIFFKVNH